MLGTLEEINRGDDESNYSLLFSVDFRKLRYIIGSELHIEYSVSDRRVSLT
jgi:hypothetical protein